MAEPYQIVGKYIYIKTFIHFTTIIAKDILSWKINHITNSIQQTKSLLYKVWQWVYAAVSEEGNSKDDEGIGLL